MPTTEEQIAELQARIAELEKAAKPPERIKSNYQPINPIDRLSMPASAMAALVEAVPTDLVRSIVSDNRSAPLPKLKVEEKKKGGWSEPAKLEPPPGQKIINQMIDAQDALDKADRIEMF